MSPRQAVRSAIAFFLVTFSTAFLANVGGRLTGWFSAPPDFKTLHMQSLGIAIIIAVITLAVGAGVRRMEAAELRSALLGAASVLLAIPLSAAAITKVWPVQWTVITMLGFLLLGVGFVVAASLRGAEHSGAHD